MRFAFIDLETTGGSATHDRITEIGLRLWREGGEVEDWQTLVNPGVRIGPFIEQLTGITNAMVADAPPFEAVAPRLREKLADTVLVAHNARFDYGFLKAAYRRLGEPFALPVLCTVKLSRALYPQHRHHNLDSLIARHGLEAGDRHRAMADVSAMFQFFQKARAEHGPHFDQQLERLLRRPSIPSHLEPEILADLPERPGVYRFYGENDVLLYVGKSTNLRQRVASHFSGDHQSTRGVRLSESLRRVDWTETAGEFGALLLEMAQIKRLKPLFNRRSRAAKGLVSLRAGPDPRGYLRVEPVREIDTQRLGDYYGLFRYQREALNTLSGLARKNGLCSRLMSLEEGSGGPCFQHQLGHCRGACIGAEDQTRYNLRVQIALHGLRLRTWPWPGRVAVYERNAGTGRTDIHLIDNWTHIATVQDEAGLNDNGGRESGLPAFDLDSYRLIVKALLGRQWPLEIRCLQTVSQ